MIWAIFEWFWKGNKVCTCAKKKHKIFFASGVIIFASGVKLKPKNWGIVGYRGNSGANNLLISASGVT